MLNTGSARYSVPIALPQGTAGHAPNLTLQYDSGLGFSAIAPGWTYGPGSISRRVDKGIPRYVDGPNGVDDDSDNQIDEPDETDIFIGPDGEELVRMADGEYRARIEGSFARFRRVEQEWQIDLKNGTTLEFGSSSLSRIDSSDGSRIFRWLLSKSTDVNGNTIEYSWVSLPGSENQKYLKEIRYGPESSPWTTFYFVSFTYESRQDWRKDYRSGFLVRSSHRLTRIHTGIQGQSPEQCAVGDWNSDTVPDSLINRYQLTYNQVSPGIEQLVNITRYGSDGITPLPPISFGYSSALPEHSLSAADSIITSLNSPAAVMDNQLVDLIDLNRDSLPDILKTDLYGNSHLAYLNMGPVLHEGNPKIVWSSAQGINSADQLATGLHLVEDTVSLADMNGDGISDLVHNSLANETFYYRNKGDLSWDSRTPMSIQETAPPTPFAFDNVKTADVDFNKRMDVVKSTENSYSTWLNYRDGVYSREIVTAGARYNDSMILLSDSGVDFADMNGDRISDVIQVTPFAVLYCAGMGYGNFADGIAIALPDIVLTDGDNSQVSRAKLSDINGDGLADLVLERATANELWFWLNLGTDSFSAQYTITGMPTQYGINTVVRWADMNGNGTTDLVYADSSAVEKLRIIDIGKLISGSSHPNLLTAIDNGLGRVITISYSSSTEQALQAFADDDPWSTTIPFPVQVVSRVEVSTGTDLDMIPGTDTYLKTYVYRDGFYEDLEHQFRGFAKVTVTEPGDATAPATMTTSEFFTGGPDGVNNDNDALTDEISPDNHREEEALKGMVKALEIRDDNGTLFSRDENLWEVQDLPLANPDNKEIRLAVYIQADKYIDEGTGSPEILQTTREYDDFGNVITENNHGALSITGDEVFTSTQFINDTDNWLIGLPYLQTITDSTGQKAAETRSYYDGPAFVGLPAGSATKGHLSRQQSWVEDDTWVDVIRNSFDSYGNIIAILDPNGSRRSLTYDPPLFLFPTREDIEVAADKPDLFVSAAYNTGLGVIISSQGFNGHETSYNYDIFGRLTSIVAPGDSNELPSQSFKYSMCDPAGGHLYEYDDQGLLTLSDSDCRFSRITTAAREQFGQPGTLDTVQYVDSMGRKIYSLSEGESDFIVQGRILFNAKGGVCYSFLPYRTTLGNADNRPSLTLPHLEKRYDAAGRDAELISPPDEHGVTDNSSISYLPLSTTQTDERGNTKTLNIDGLNRLLTVNEHNNAETYITQYGYDTLGNLTSVLDNQNNLKTMVYDGLGRKTGMADPDRGTTQYWYDNASNLISTLDNKGQEIVYTYDRANRMLTEDYLDRAGLSPDVQYSYDQPGIDYPDAENLLGRLAFINDLSGASFFSYDERGNSEWNSIRIRDGDQSEDFHSASEFDAMGRATASIYPDGDRVEYTYNNRGLLESIPGFADNFDYHVSGGMQTISYANTVTTTLLHDPRHRLLETATAPQAGENIQALHYSFDPVSNISAIDDLRPIAPNLPENATQSFQYDDLNRLIHAQGPGYGAIDFQYDSIGNMIHKTSPDSGDPFHIDDPLINLQAMTYGGLAGSSNRTGRMPGDPPGPHAITATGSGLSYQYDYNGNVTNRTGDLYEWDFLDRLIRATTADSVTSYIYNAAGQRVIKKVDESGTTRSTWYVTEGYEIREGKIEKYVFAGSRRLAKIDESFTQMVHLQPGKNFISITMSIPVTELLASIGPDVEVWGWEPDSDQYLGYVPSENRYEISTLEPGRGYIVVSDQPHTLKLGGTPTGADIQLSSGWNLVGTLVDREMTMAEVEQLLSNQVESAWGYDTATGTWHSFLTDGPDFLNSLATMVPDRAYWVQLSGPVTLSPVQPDKITHFYHPDHLGSSSLVTDNYGTVVERVEYYPYGRPRYEFRDNFDSPYKYTDKELDKETGLMYYEARYYDSVVGRFVSVDPLLVEKVEVGEGEDLNLYSYAGNNPIVYIDPNGTNSFKYLKNKLRGYIFKTWKALGKTPPSLIRPKKKLPIPFNDPKHPKKRVPQPKDPNNRLKGKATAIWSIARNPKYQQGFTVDLGTIQHLNKTQGYSVAYSATQDSFGVKDLKKVIKHARFRGDKKIGGWLDEGKYYFDSVKYITDKKDAHKFALENKQLGYYDFSIPEVVNTRDEVESSHEGSHRQ